MKEGYWVFLPLNLWHLILGIRNLLPKYQPKRGGDLG